MAAIATLPPEPAGDGTEELELFQSILQNGELRTEFQPVMDLRNRTFHGFEALIRGPAGSPLEPPDRLFHCARQSDSVAALDRLCAQTSVEAFARRGLAGNLFINVSEALLESGWLTREPTLRWLQEQGLAPSRLVLELLESDALTEHAEAFQAAQFLRELGYGLALDDLGQGFGRFALWKRLRPRYLKIDRAYTEDLASDPFKTAFVRSMLLLAEASQSVVVAEGVEAERDLLTLRELGIGMAQGYFIARPTAQPQPAPSEALRDLLGQAQPTLHALASRGSIEQSVLGLARQIEPVQPQTKLDQVLRMLEQNPDLTSVPVVDGAGRALGIINRYVVADRLFRPHVRDLFGNKPCTLVMSGDVLRLDAKASLQQASSLIADSSYRHATEGVLVSEGGLYRGLLLVGDLLRLVTEFQVQAARYANPLTLLPGNVPINDCIDRWLHEDRAFAAAYADIDHFKPFNDKFGYRMGDEIILMLSDLLRARMPLGRHFLGHVGGDDFVVLSCSADWEQELRGVLDAFEQGVAQFFEPAVLEQGGYWADNRRGEAMFFPVPSLSIGALPVDPQRFDSHREVANVLAELKRAAKRLPGNALFVERRRHD